MVLCWCWCRPSSRKFFSLSASTASRGPGPRKPQDAGFARWRSEPVRCLFALLLSLLFALVARPQTHNVRIGVLGIFHPQQLTLAADQTGELLISTPNHQIFLQPRSACSVLSIRSSGEDILISCGDERIKTSELLASGRNQQSAGLVITVPGKITRRYRGTLEVKAKPGELIPVVTMDLKTA